MLVITNQPPFRILQVPLVCGCVCVLRMLLPNTQVLYFVPHFYALLSGHFALSCSTSFFFIHYFRPSSKQLQLNG